MELTPLDIRNQTFHKKSFKGYDPEEVKAFLETTATAFENMFRDRTNYFIRCRALIHSQDELLSAMENDQQKEFEAPATIQNDGIALT